MTESAFLQHQRYAVLGAGRSGLAASRLLVERGKDVVLFDDRADARPEGLEPLVEAGVSLRFGKLGDAQAEAANNACQAVVVSPGFAPGHPLLAAADRLSLPARSELELGWLCRGGAVVAAITGTNGKTTVTMLVARILADGGRRAVACGNIGLPLCDAVRELGDAPAETILATEVSSFQLETVERFAPEVAVILNITPDHLDRHETIEAYADLKQRLTDNQGPDQVLVINQDDPLCLAIATRSKARVRRFSLQRPVEDGAWLDGDLIFIREPGARPRRLLATDELQLIGMHNVANAMAAATACQAFGLSHKQIAETLRTFRAAPHRLEPLGEHVGINYVNDSKATNLDSMMRAVESFAGGVHLIAGGRDKNSPFASVAAQLKTRVRTAYLIGEAAPAIETAWSGHVDCVPCGTLERALETASARAEAGDVVLLAPGCASFDQFTSYEHRGNVFAEWAKRKGTAHADTPTNTHTQDSHALP